MISASDKHASVMFDPETGLVKVWSPETGDCIFNARPTTDTKLAAALQLIANEAAKITPESREEMLNALVNCAKTLRRAAKRAETPSGEFRRVEIAPMRGATVEFTGQLLRLDQFTTARGKIRLEIWQTEGGSLVAVDSFDDGEHGERIKVCTPSGGIEDQRMAIMQFFCWSNRARNMASKLGWNLRQDLE